MNITSYNIWIEGLKDWTTCKNINNIHSSIIDNKIIVDSCMADIK